MSDFFLHIYRYFQHRRIIFCLLLVHIFILIGILASKISFDEDISQSVSGPDKNEHTGYVIRNLKLTDKLIVDISLADSVAPANPDELGSFGRKFVDSLNARFDTAIIRSITFRTSDSAMVSLMELVMDHLPTFYDEQGYASLDSILQPASIEKALQQDYKILVSPASMVLKKHIRQDPLGISNMALSKLKSLRVSDNFDIRNGCIYTSDLRHLIIIIVPANSAGETHQNDKLVTALDEIILRLSAGGGPAIRAQYFGGAAIAVCNARQLKRDIILTLLIAFVLIFLLIGWYFRNFRVPLMGFLPAVFGGALSLAVLYVFKGKISAISLGIGSIILGLIVDYSLYLVNHFRRRQDVELTIREMSLTIALCSLTSAGAFICLTFLRSVVLQDLGWFAAISVVGAALFTLLVLPHLLGGKLLRIKNVQRLIFVDRLASIQYDKKRWLIGAFLLIGLLSVFFAGKVKFERNMASLSFLTPKLAKAETDLDKISSYKLKNVYLVATGNTLEQTLRNQEQISGRIQQLVRSGTIRGISNAGPLLTSDSLQQCRISRWNSYWTPELKSRLKTDLLLLAKKYGYTSSAFDSFFELVERSYRPLSLAAPEISKNPVISEWVMVNREMVLAPVILRISEENTGVVYKAFPPDSRYVMIDRQRLTLNFIENVKHDFDLLVTLSMIFVTLLLIVSFGRLGLGLMTALPMFFSWLITVGFMGMTGIRFNIFNIIISSFIFGLGVDYSILMMRGLQHSLRSGRDDLHPYKVSVLLSAFTTLFGVGALFVARHPALSSIATVSVVGIVAVVILSFIFLPLIFNIAVLSRQRKHEYPITFMILVKTVVTWTNIVLVALILMIAGNLIKLLPFKKQKKKELFFHRLFYWLTKAYIAVTFANDRKLINEHGEDFTRPAIIISNHQSLIETPAFLRLYPKIIILTTSWVHSSPIFGPIAKLASFFDVNNGIDSIIGQLQAKVDEGFSILIFPEAHRSEDHKIQRFHRGAFYLAERLQTDILPVVVFGTGDFLGKGNFWGRPNSLRMKILKRVSCSDDSMGATYQERAKQFRKLYIDQYAIIRQQEGDAHYYSRKLALNYVLKGPVLEWYMRVKMKLENNYEIYNRLLPRRGEILDLGCGYGFISYMLMFTSEERTITSVDYDAEKISVAAGCFSKNDRISFHCADISGFEITPKNGILLCDVLHYLTPEKQLELLRRCFSGLLPGGRVLIREANTELKKRHSRSKLTEFISTGIGFNKTQNAEKLLYFTSAEQIRMVAAEFGMVMEVIDNTRMTSNVLYVIKKDIS